MFSSKTSLLASFDADVELRITYISYKAIQFSCVIGHQQPNLSTDMMVYSAREACN